MNTEILEQLTLDLGFIPDILELDYHENLSLGQGFDSLFGIPGGFTVINSEDRIIPTAFTAIDAVNTTYSLRIIENNYQLREMMKMSASASFKTGIYSAGGSYSSFNSKSINSYDTYIFADVESTKVAKHINPRELTDPTLSILQHGYEDFLKFAGDKFVSGIQFGAKLTMLIRVITGKNESYASVRANIQAGISSFVGGKASFESTLSTCIENKQIEIFILRKGGKDELPNIQEAVNYSRRIPLIAIEAPYPLSYYLSDYTSVNNIFIGHINNDLLIQRTEKIEYLISPCEMLQNYITDLKYAYENLELFNIDRDVIIDEIEKAATILIQINKYVRKLYHNPNFEVPEIRVLERINLERKKIEFIYDDYILKIYRQTNHNGDPLKINDSISSMPSWDWNDAMMSYVLKEGYRATFYRDSQFRGRSIVVTGPSNPNTIEEFSPIWHHLSSVRIEKIID